MSATPHSLTMQKRENPSRPFRLGTRRRRAPQGRAASGAGASRFGRKAKAPSLDTEKQLATSAFEWLDSTRTPEDQERERERIHRQLRRSVFEIWQSHASRPKDHGEAQWREAYEAERAPRDGETEAQLWDRVLRWTKKNRPTGRNADVLKWEKQYSQLQRCQREFIAYRAACCGDASPAIAVPIGCNHRLCPFCAWHRSKRAIVKIKTMFDRLTHPVFITLTIPNIPNEIVDNDGNQKKLLKKHVYTLFRQRIRQFIAQHKGWILGGIYSLETTYNRTEKTWHIHCHILADVSAPLPSKKEKIELAGQRVYAFTAMKLKLEFDWLRLFSTDWGKMHSKNASEMRRNGYTYTFEEWVKEGRANRIKEWRDGAYRPIEGLSAAETARRTKWNASNRRVIDLRPVDDRDKAAREVLKYITKAADFADLPEAIEPFMDATKSARLVQTFGSWYGVNFDTNFDPDHLDDWGERKCTCGLNMWERIGIVHRHDCVMDPTGRWLLNRSFNHRCGGTVPRPTIRILDVHSE